MCTINIYAKKITAEIPAEQSGKMLIIKHRVLEDISRNLKITVDMKVINSGKDHAVVICKITSDGVDYVSIGEAVPETLWSEGDKMYPVTVAWNRAFDRSMIKLLDIDGNVYSSCEVKKTKEKTSDQQPETQKMPEAVVQEETVEKKEDAPLPEVVRAPKGPETKYVKPSKNNRTDDIRDEVMLFGKFKGQRIRDVENLKSFYEYARWVKQERVAFNDEKKMRQVRYLIKKGEKSAG